MKALAEKLEQLAQEIYDLRDSIPAEHNRLWDRADELAKRLSRIAGKVRLGHL